MSALRTIYNAAGKWNDHWGRVKTLLWWALLGGAILVIGGGALVEAVRRAWCGSDSSRSGRHCRRGCGARGRVSQDGPGKDSSRGAGFEGHEFGSPYRAGARSYSVSDASGRVTHGSPAFSRIVLRNALGANIEHCRAVVEYSNSTRFFAEGLEGEVGKPCSAAAGLRTGLVDLRRHHPAKGRDRG